MQQQKSLAPKKKQKQKIQPKNIYRIEQTSIYPSARAHHISTYYHNKIYIWAGQTLDKSDSQYLYVYNIKQKKWNRKDIYLEDPIVSRSVGMCEAIQNSNWYIFGGVFPTEQYSNKIYVFDLQSLEATICESKGIQPPPSSQGKLAFFAKHWLLHYPGRNPNIDKRSSQIYIYNTSSKNWYLCQGDFPQVHYFRENTAICVDSGLVYIFGGSTRICKSQQCLNDMAIIKITVPKNKQPGRIQTRFVQSSFQPPPRQGHTLFTFNSRFICLTGGYNNDIKYNDLWLFDKYSEEWHQESLQLDGMDRIGYSCVFNSDTLFIFGGNSVQENMPTNQLCEMKFDTKSVDSLMSRGSKKNYNCQICHQKQQHFFFQHKTQSKSLVKDIKDLIQFPFAALGLLLDNAIMLNATKVSVSVFNHNQRNFQRNIIKIQDNGKIPWDQQELIQSFLSFKYEQNIVLETCHKNTKKDVKDQNSKKQYGLNLKLGGLRLGQQILFISIGQKHTYIFLLKFQNNNLVMHYYTLNGISRTTIDPQMQKQQQYIQSHYKQYIIQSIAHKNKYKNIVFIFDSIINGNQCHVAQNHHIDVLYGNKQSIQQLNLMGYPTKLCIDISLRAYITALYLPMPHLKYIELNVNRRITEVSFQQEIEKVDKFCRRGLAVDLGYITDFEFKHSQLYALKKPKSVHNIFFNNGLLIYSHNRLIDRYRYPLGTLAQILRIQSRQSINLTPIFGFIQLPDAVPINSTKTGFTFGVMLQQLYSRLKFMQQGIRMRVKCQGIDLPLQMPQVRSQQKQIQSGKRQRQNQDQQDQRDVVKRPRRNPKINLKYAQFNSSEQMKTFRHQGTIRRRQKGQIIKAELLPDRQLRKQMEMQN